MNDIIQLKISLDDSNPLIWRRVLVRKSYSFMRLHHIIQTIMGWDSYHLFEFQIDDEQIGGGDEEMGFYEGKNASRVKLSTYITRPKQRFSYIYDFGDWWEHTIIVEKFLPADKNTVVPVCIDGAMNAPPEDCGGIWGFYELLEILKDKNHPEHKEMSEWLGYDYDPEYFDINEINEMLRELS